MAGIQSVHVRAATSFLGSPRYLQYSPPAQALWWQLQRFALDERREFLPEEYTVDIIARAWGQELEPTTAAIAELAGGPRPIIGTIEVRYEGAGAYTLIRVRGAREKQPVGWKDETDLAGIWNDQHPGDPVDVAAFEEVIVKQKQGKGGSKPRTRKRVAKSSDKRSTNVGRTSNDHPTTVGQTLMNAGQMGNRREEKRREEEPEDDRPTNERRSSAPPADDDGHGASEGSGNNGADPRLVERFEKLVVGWGTAPDSDVNVRKRAMMFLSADPARVIANVLELDSNVQRWPKPWDEFAKRLSTAAMPKDEDFYKRAKKLIREVTA